MHSRPRLTAARKAALVPFTACLLVQEYDAVRHTHIAAGGKGDQVTQPVKRYIEHNQERGGYRLQFFSFGLLSYEVSACCEIRASCQEDPSLGSGTDLTLELNRMIASG